MNALTIIGHFGREKILAEYTVYLQADVNYTMVHTVGKAKHTMSFTLKKVEERIAGFDFVRINSGLSINKNYLLKISHLKKEGFLMLTNGQKLPISRRRFNEITKIINY